MRLRVNTENKKRFFTVPCYISDDYIKLADLASLRLIIYLLSEDTDEFDPDKTASRLGITKDALEDAVLFWEQQGVILRYNEDQQLQSESLMCSTSLDKQQSKALCVRSGYSPKYIAQLLETDKDMLELMKEAEKTLGRLLKHSDHELMINLKDYFGFSVQSIILILEYCRDLGKTSARYIESVANDFSDKGIMDFLAIDAEIKQRKEASAFENKIMRALGLDVKPTSKQSVFIASWKEMGFSIDLIKEARERCVDATNKLSFGYINKILKTWSENKIYTLEAVEAFNSKHTAIQSKESSFDIDEFDRFTLGIPDKD